MIDTKGKKEYTAVLVGLITKDQSEEKAAEYLDELAFLAETLGITTKKVFTQRLHMADSRTFIGAGKLEAVKEYIEEHEIDAIIFDDDLSPSQMKNIEKALKIQVYDRSLLILDIFQQRAQTAQAKTQVELARSQYLLPRLTRMWTHLERQRGGTGTRGGAGEKEIETDRRIIRDKISKLRKSLVAIDKQMATQRKNRGKLIRVALVGYTNVGKSTLMNILSKSEVFAENKLFATLDTTVRKVVVENLPFLLTDTVGFIRKLPHQLVESFKSTLDEVREADLLIHVVDISHPQFEDHIKAVNATLAEITKNEKPTIYVFNKIDLYTAMEEGEFDFTGDTPHHISLTDLQKSLEKRFENRCILISAQQKTNLKELRTLLYESIKEMHAQRFPYNEFLY